MASHQSPGPASAATSSSTAHSRSALSTSLASSHTHDARKTNPSHLESRTVSIQGVDTAAAKPQSNTFFRSCEISLMEPVGSMSISPANRDVVLAARKGLFILDLEEPYVPPRFLAHMTTWEAVDIQWNPHPARSNWVASTSNQKLLVWNLDRPTDPRAVPLDASTPLQSSYLAPSSSPLTSKLSAYHGVFAPPAHSVNSATAASLGIAPTSAHSPFVHTAANSSTASHFGSRAVVPSTAPRSSAIEHILHAHTRAITDINWSPFHPEVLASCSMDTWTWVWDLRMSGTGPGGRRKPAQGYSTWNAAVTQVKFNRASEHRLASTCDNKVFIWDDRKGSLPLATIEAHESKIYSIDWSRDTSLGLDRLLTCSLDRTVKFWDLSSPSAQNAVGARELITEAESVIETRTPVWRARHLPFGNGVMTLPQRGDTSLSMWAKDHPEAPMAVFEGHTDIVKEYLFRTKGGQNRDCDDRRFQLITWSKDQTLRLWPVSEEQTKSVGHKPGAPIRVLNTRAYAPDISYRDPPPLAALAEQERCHESKDLGSTSSITVSSIMPPEHATRSLLSGRGSGSRINGPSPYGSSHSGFQSGFKEGRMSPAAAFSSSLGHRPFDRRIYPSSSHSSLRGDRPALQEQTDALPRSLGRADLYGRSMAGPLGSSLPRGLPAGVAAQTAALAVSPARQMHRIGTPHHQSSRLPESNKSGGSFKLPNSLREGAVPKLPGNKAARKARPGRSYSIQEEGFAKCEGNAAREADGAKEADAKDATARRKKHSRRTLGAPMRLDRARLAGPAVDPIGWIANVRIQRESGDDSRQVSDDATNGRGSGREMSRQASGKGTSTGGGGNGGGMTSAGETDGEDGLSSQRLGDEIVALNRKLPRILFEMVEVSQRTCTLSMYGPWADRESAFLRVTIIVPTSYPRSPPTFNLERSANITLKTRAYLLRGLTRLAAQAAEMQRPCIELCCRFLLGEPVDLLDGDEGEAGNASHKATSTGSLTDSEDELAPSPRTRIKMPARWMGASFGPNGELVVFGQRSVVFATTAARRTSDGSRSGSGEGRGSAAPSSRSRSKSRPRTKEARAGEREESRFLRSYSALSSAMSSLARFSKGDKHGLRDSDVVQLMSSDFFARRILDRGRGGGEGGGDTMHLPVNREERRPSLVGLTPLHAEGVPAKALDGVERRGERRITTVVRIYSTGIGGPSAVAWAAVAAAPLAAGPGKRQTKPPLGRKRSHSEPRFPMLVSPSQKEEAGTRGGRDDLYLI
ncbi:hypothetical protein ACQY0O_005892 [Thecaphora frezii]